MQNLPRGSQLAGQHCEAITTAIRTGSPLPIKIDVVDAVTSTIRSAFRAKPGHHFSISDYSSIENRILAWVAASAPMQRVFDMQLDPYKDFATRLFRKPYEEVTKVERGLSKPAVLGSGYGAGGPRLAEYAKSMGVDLDIETATRHVEVFRSAYPEVPALWASFDDLAKAAVRNRAVYSHFSGICFDARDPRYLAIGLPTGRRLYYLNARIEKTVTAWGLRDELVFECGGSRGFQTDRTYGPKLVENVVQAIARDILADGLIRATRAGFSVVGHVHDEIVVEEPVGGRPVAELEALMSQTPAWAQGLSLAASGFASEYYKKD